MKLAHLIESDAADEAHKKNLEYAGYGKWKNKSGDTVAKTIDNKLVPIVDDEKDVHGIVDHLLSRGMDPEKHKIYIDKKLGVATFPLFNLSGQLVGYQQYNPAGSKKNRTNDKLLSKYYTYTTKTMQTPNSHKLAVWGLESLDLRDDILFLVEGIFDAVKIQNAGYPAIAVLANDPKPIRGWLYTLGNRKIVSIIDNDENESGKKLSAISHKSYEIQSPYHDVGDMPQDMVGKLIYNIASKVL